MENRKEMEKVLKSFCKKFELDYKKVQIDSDGLVIYNGNVCINGKDLTTIPKALRYFKEIKGSFYIDDNHFENLEGLENLRIIGEDFHCNRVGLNGFIFKGLGNLELIGRNFSCCTWYSNTTSFEDLKSLKNVRGNIYLFEQCIKSFEGLYDCKFNNIFPEDRKRHFEIELSERNGKKWFDAYQDIDSYLMEELGDDFIVNFKTPQENTIASIKLLVARNVK